MTGKWTYEVKTGRLYDPTGELIATGYSGIGSAKNDPLHEHDVAKGPIPRGEYKIGPVIDPPSHTGPFAMRLTPLPGTNDFGRSAFEIHGDSATHPGQASHGCIIFIRAVRLLIIASPIKELSVI